MATNDIYVSHIVFDGNCRSTAMDLANAIQNEIIRRDLRFGELRFILVSPPSSTHATAFISFYDRKIHFDAVTLLDKLSFRGQPTVWKLGRNEPLSSTVPNGAQFNADKRTRSERHHPYRQPSSRISTDSTRPGISGTQRQPKDEPAFREPYPPRRFTALEETLQVLKLSLPVSIWIAR